ncbi:MAG: hypothetical protein P8075_19600, partial [Deltaproteobacteria bacterium]
MPEEADQSLLNLRELRSQLLASRRAFALGLLALMSASLLSIVAAAGIGRLHFPWETVIEAIGQGLGLLKSN